MKHLHILTSVIVLFISIWLLTSCAVSGNRIEQTFNTVKQNNTVFDAIIVPGVPFDKEEAKWSTIMKARVYWAVYLYQNGITKNIIFSGSSVYTPYYESKIMALYAQKLGIPKENIIVESKAEHSTENVYYSYTLAKKHAFKKIALTTDPFQSAMLQSFIERNNLNIESVPVVFSIIDVFASHDPDIDYNIALNENFTSIKEREGFFKRFKGTRGQNIDYGAYASDSLAFGY